MTKRRRIQINNRKRNLLGSTNSTNFIKDHKMSFNKYTTKLKYLLDTILNWCLIGVALPNGAISENIRGADLNLPQSSCIFLSWVVLLSGCPLRTLTHQQFVSSHCFDSNRPSLRQIAVPPVFKKSVQGFFAISYSRKGFIVTSSLPADMVTANA